MAKFSPPHFNHQPTAMRKFRTKTDNSQSTAKVKRNARARRRRVKQARSANHG